MRVTGNFETVTYVTCMYMPPNSVNPETLNKKKVILTDC